MKVIFEEGCFDSIADEMTQEELDELKAEIERLNESGELFSNSKKLSREEENEVLQVINSQKKNTRQ